MREAAFRRPGHRVVADLLAKMDAAFLARTGCCFGGGTRIVLELGEYRESRDIDFLCSSREGYRRLREAVTERSLGPVAKRPLSLAREVRADQYGIRTFLETGSAPLKFEIIREARIDLEAGDVRSIPVPCLTRKDCFAEKFLANADRGLDTSTLSRDIVDLAFMIEGWSKAEADAGMAIGCHVRSPPPPQSCAPIGPIETAAWKASRSTTPRRWPPGSRRSRPTPDNEHLASNYLSIHAVLFHRSFVETGHRFDAAFPIFYDRDFWPQLSASADFVFTGRATAYYWAESGASGSGAGPNLDRGQVLEVRARLMRKWGAAAG
jgi:hypothetical protein